MTKRHILTATLLGCFIALTSAAWAGGLPDYYPSTFNKWGIIDRLDISRGEIVVNDTLMHISDNVKVHTTSTRFASVRALGKGAIIGVIFSTTSSVKRMIDEIWILPDDYSAGSD